MEIDAGGGAMTASAVAAGSVQDLVRDAAELGTPLRIAGRSTWIDAGRPVSATRIASLATHEGIVDYVPGDLTITVRSGTTLGEIERVTSAEGQWLPLNPFGGSTGTIGATIATGSFGPLAHAFGRARDLVLGVEFVTGEGRVVRGGGRVVKNVAGFDLVRLVTGSWGTLGVITEATLRLYSRRGESVTRAMTVPDRPGAVRDRIDAILTAPHSAFAVELVSGTLAGWLKLPARPTILVELGGNAESIAAQTRTLTTLGGMSDVAPDAWERLRIAEDKVRSADAVAALRARDSRSVLASGDAEPPKPAVVRFSTVPARVGELWAAIESATASVDGAMHHATPRLGIVRCILPPNSVRETVTRIRAGVPGVTTIYERLPSTIWAELSPSVVSDRLSQRVRRAFDPHGILNRGILGPTS